MSGATSSRSSYARTAGQQPSTIAPSTLRQGAAGRQARSVGSAARGGPRGRLGSARRGGLETDDQLVEASDVLGAAQVPPSAPGAPGRTQRTGLLAAGGEHPPATAAAARRPPPGTPTTTGGARCA